MTSLTWLNGWEMPSALHVHTPLLHDVAALGTPPVQSLPHSPQLLTSVWRLTHWFVQSVVPRAHVGVDTQQNAPGGHVPPSSGTGTCPYPHSYAHGANAPSISQAPPSSVACLGEPVGVLGRLGGVAQDAERPHAGFSPGSTRCTPNPKLVVSTGGHGTLSAIVSSRTNQKVDPSDAVLRGCGKGTHGVCVCEKGGCPRDGAHCHVPS